MGLIMKIAILDVAVIGKDIDYSRFSELGECALYDHTSDEDFLRHCHDCEVLISNRVSFNAERIAALPNLKLICSAATGYNLIDIEAAQERGIALANVPAYSTHSVTQFTLAMAFYLLMEIYKYDSFVKTKGYSQGTLSTNLEYPWHDLSGLQWGVIGLGAIGKSVARVVSALGSQVVYYSVSGNNTCTDYPRVSLEELLRSSDIISIHAPLSPLTQNLLNAENLVLLKSTALLINVGRGSIVDENELARMLNENCIGGVALDVFETEPLQLESPLLSVSHPEKLLMTPHVAWSSLEARKKLVSEIFENIAAFVRGEKRNRIC